MIKRSSKKFIDNLLNQNQTWKVLDIGCGYTPHENANVICDIQDLSNFYKDKEFIKLNDKTLPFKDKEFDFVIPMDGDGEDKPEEIKNFIQLA